MRDAASVVKEIVVEEKIQITETEETIEEEIPVPVQQLFKPKDENDGKDFMTFIYLLNFSLSIVWFLSPNSLTLPCTNKLPPNISKTLQNLNFISFYPKPKRLESITDARREQGNGFASQSMHESGRQRGSYHRFDHNWGEPSVIGRR